MNTPREIILGIDPGTIVMGYGLIEIKKNTPHLLEMGVLKLSKYKDTTLRLKIIYNKIAELHQAYHPTAFAIEAPFFGKNVQSMLKLGRAQGVAIASNLQYGIDVHEYSPKKIKQSVTGNGNASKEQVWKMLQQILHFTEKPTYMDATDALSVALCHYYQSKNILTGVSKEKNWEAFIKNNPNRIKK